MNVPDKHIAVPPLRGALAHGALWTILVAVAGKVVGLAVQLALAHFLFPEDFGVVAFVLAVAAAVSMFGGTHLGTLLIHKQGDATHMAGQVFWLSLCMSSLGGILLAAIAPMAANSFGDGRVTLLLLLVALACPVMALPTVYSATLARELKFSAVSKITLVVGLAQNGSALVFAWLGFGPYSLVLPLLVNAFASAIMYRWAAGRIKLERPVPHEWVALLASVAWVLANGFFLSARAYGANFVASTLEKNAEVVGYFYWGSTITFQAIFLLSTSLHSVFFPGLARLNAEPQRQLAALRRANLVLGYVAVLVCVAQLLLAGPILNLVFGDKWARAVPVVQWLSLSVITQPLNMLASSLLLARGEFKTMAISNALSAVMAMLACAGGTMMGAERELGAWVGVATLLANCFPAVACYQVSGISMRPLAGDFVGFAALTAGVYCVAKGGMTVIGRSGLDHWAAVIPIVGMLVLGLHYGLGRLITPAAVKDLTMLLLDQAAKFRNRQFKPRVASPCT